MPVLAEEFEIVSRLDQLALRRDLLLDVVRAAVGGRRRATAFHPKSAGGLQSWIEGTGHLRRIFIPRGWEICSRDNIESIFHADSDAVLTILSASNGENGADDRWRLTTAGMDRLLDGFLGLGRVGKVGAVLGDVLCNFLQADRDRLLLCDEHGRNRDRRRIVRLRCLGGSDGVAQ